MKPTIKKLKVNNCIRHYDNKYNLKSIAYNGETVIYLQHTPTGLSYVVEILNKSIYNDYVDYCENSVVYKTLEAAIKSVNNFIDNFLKLR